MCLVCSVGWCNRAVNVQNMMEWHLWGHVSPRVLPEITRLWPRSCWGSGGDRNTFGSDEETVSFPPEIKDNFMTIKSSSFISVSLIPDVTQLDIFFLKKEIWSKFYSQVPSEIVDVSLHILNICEYKVIFLSKGIKFIFLKVKVGISWVNH